MQNFVLFGWKSSFRENAGNVICKFNSEFESLQYIIKNNICHYSWYELHDLSLTDSKTMLYSSTTTTQFVKQEILKSDKDDKQPSAMTIRIPDGDFKYPDYYVDLLVNLQNKNPINLLNMFQHLSGKIKHVTNKNCKQLIVLIPCEISRLELEAVNAISDGQVSCEIIVDEHKNIRICGVVESLEMI